MKNGEAVDSRAIWEYWCDSQAVYLFILWALHQGWPSVSLMKKIKACTAAQQLGYINIRLRHDCMTIWMNCPISSHLHSPLWQDVPLLNHVSTTTRIEENNWKWNNNSSQLDFWRVFGVYLAQTLWTSEWCPVFMSAGCYCCPSKQSQHSSVFFTWWQKVFGSSVT